MGKQEDRLDTEVNKMLFYPGAETWIGAIVGGEDGSALIQLIVSGGVTLALLMSLRSCLSAGVEVEYKPETPVAITEARPTEVPTEVSVLTSVPTPFPDIVGGQYPTEVQDWINNNGYNELQNYWEVWAEAGILAQQGVTSEARFLPIFNPDNPEGDSIYPAIVVYDSNGQPERWMFPPVDLEASVEAGKIVFRQLSGSPSDIVNINDMDNPYRPLFITPDAAGQFPLQEGEFRHLEVRDGIVTLVNQEGTLIAKINPETGQWEEVEQESASVSTVTEEEFDIESGVGERWTVTSNIECVGSSGTVVPVTLIVQEDIGGVKSLVINNIGLANRHADFYVDTNSPEKYVPALREALTEHGVLSNPKQVLADAFLDAVDLHTDANGLVHLEFNKAGGERGSIDFRPKDGFVFMLAKSLAFVRSSGVDVRATLVIPKEVGGRPRELFAYGIALEGNELGVKLGTLVMIGIADGQMQRTLGDGMLWIGESRVNGLYLGTLLGLLRSDQLGGNTPERNTTVFLDEVNCEGLELFSIMPNVGNGNTRVGVISFGF